MELTGSSDIEGKAVTGNGEQAGTRASFNGAEGFSDIEHANEGMELLGRATQKAKPRWVAASERGSERVSIARVDGNAARVAGASTGQCE
jgi:hypothetical protein